MADILIFSDSAIYVEQNYIIYSIVVKEPESEKTNRYTKRINKEINKPYSSKSELGAINFALKYILETKMIDCKNKKIIIFNDNIKVIRRVKSAPAFCIWNKVRKIESILNSDIKFIWVPRELNLAGLDIKLQEERGIQ